RGESPPRSNVSVKEETRRAALGLHAVRRFNSRNCGSPRGRSFGGACFEEAGAVVNQKENKSGGEQQSEHRHASKMSAPVSILLRWNGCIGGSGEDLTLRRRKLGAEKADYAAYQTEYLYSQRERVAPPLEFE